MPASPSFDAIVRGHRTVRAILAALTKVQRPNADRAAAIALGNEAAVALSVALIVRQDRRDRAVADARDDLAVFVRHLDPAMGAPVRAVLAELRSTAEMSRG